MRNAEKVAARRGRKAAEETAADGSLSAGDDDEEGGSGITIMVNPEWRLVHDGLQFRVQQRIVREKGKHQGEHVWKNRGYCRTLDSAIYYLFSNRIYAIPGTFPGCDAITLLTQALEDIQKEVRATLLEAQRVGAPMKMAA